MKTSNKSFPLSAMVLVAVTVSVNASWAAPTKSAATPPAKTAPAAATKAPAQPEIFTDSDGRQYTLEKLEKKGLKFVLVDKTHLRTPWGITVEVAKEDAQFFYYKVYKVPAEIATGPSHSEPSAEEKAAVDETYKFDLQSVDRLRFSPWDAGLPHVGQWRNGFVIVDINGDGNLDIVHGPARKGARHPEIFLGDGKGNWHPWQTHFEPAAYDYGDIAVADLNGDGKLDLVLAVHLKGLLALLGDGKGNFRLWTQGLDFASTGPGSAASFSSQAIAVTDWDGDGKPDILALGEGPRMNTSRGEEGKAGSSIAYGAVLYRNLGGGHWARLIDPKPAGDLFGDRLALGNFKGDGTKAFMISSGAMDRRDLLHVADGSTSWTREQLPLIRPRAYVTSIAVADFDKDGRDDIAVAYFSSEAGEPRAGVDILLSKAKGWERVPLFSSKGMDRVNALGAGDLDGDGKPDLVVGVAGGFLRVFLGNGDGHFAEQEKSAALAPLDEGCEAYTIRVVDLDHDGRGDIVANFAGEPSPMFATGQCRSGGSLRVWKTALVTPQGH